MDNNNNNNHRTSNLSDSSDLSDVASMESKQLKDYKSRLEQCSIYQLCMQAKHEKKNPNHLFTPNYKCSPSLGTIVTTYLNNKFNSDTKDELVGLLKLELTDWLLKKAFTSSQRLDFMKQFDPREGLRSRAFIDMHRGTTNSPYELVHLKYKLDIPEFSRLSIVQFRVGGQVKRPAHKQKAEQEDNKKLHASKKQCTKLQNNNNNTNSSNDNTIDSVDECKICMAAPCNIVLIAKDGQGGPCNHNVCCSNCADQLATCPICIKPIQDRIAIFKS